MRPQWAGDLSGPTSATGAHLHEEAKMYIFQGLCIPRSGGVLTQNVPTLTIFTQEWTTNGFGLLLLPFPDTLPRVSVSPELHLFWQAAFLTAFNTSPFTRTLSKERQSIIFEKRIAKHLAGDEWEVTCLIWWNICWRIPKCRSAWANLREFPNLCKKQNLHPRNSKYHSYYLAC